MTRVKVLVEIEVLEGDDEGEYREEFRRELAERLLNIRNTLPAREAVEEILREQERVKEREALEG